MAPQSPFLAGSEYPVHAKDLLSSEAWPCLANPIALSWDVGLEGFGKNLYSEAGG
jgi:hypothetical protein